MKTLVKKSFEFNAMKRQTGVALFFALVALVILSLAAVALIRSVDTNTLVAGNLAFQQSATSSADAGLEAAITQIASMRDAAGNSGKNVIQNATHTLNITNLGTNPGYFSNIGTTLTTAAQLMADSTWSTAGNAVTLPQDASGNSVQYIIQRTCRYADVAIKDADCLFSAATVDDGGKHIKLSEDICEGNNCPSSGQTPEVRVTVRVTGPRNSVSFVQAFIH